MFCGAACPEIRAHLREEQQHDASQAQEHLFEAILRKQGYVMCCHELDEKLNFNFSSDMFANAVVRVTFLIKQFYTAINVQYVAAHTNECSQYTVMLSENVLNYI